MRLPKVGVRIKIMCNSFSLCKKGETGTVVAVDVELRLVGVRFDNYSSDRHDCDGRCEYGHGRWFLLEYFTHEGIKMVPRNNLLA